MTATIFVSSTPFDLALHRKKIADAVAHKAGKRPALTVVGVLPETSLEERLRLVRSAQVFIAVIGMVYGNVDPLSNKALTQLEYDEAQAYCVPSLIYIIDEDEHLVLPKHVDTGTSAHRLGEFKATLTQLQDVRFFSSADDLVEKIKNDLLRVFAPMQAAVAQADEKPADRLAETPAMPVVQSDAPVVQSDAPTFKSKYEKRYTLTPPRFEFFKDKVKHIFDHDISDETLKDTLEFLLANNTMSASSSLARGASMPLDEAIEEIRIMERIVKETLQKLQPNPGENK